MAITISSEYYYRQWKQQNDPLFPNLTFPLNFSLRKTVHSLKDLRVAAILDPFSVLSYEPECVLLNLDGERYIEALEEFQPDIFFFESAWQGKDNAWRMDVRTPTPKFHQVVAWCKAHRVPVVFWNKEDPVHTAQFKKTAALADFVFTTEADLIPQYKAWLGHDRVYHLHFAAQPATHNPIELFDRKNKVCFAGAWYKAFPYRNTILSHYITMLETRNGIDIYDRNYKIENTPNKFPPEYGRYILGTLPSEEIDVAYKGYMYGLNMCSVTQSSTMFARRTFELGASNTLIIGNYAYGLKRFFGDLVISTDDMEEADRLIDERFTGTNARRIRLLMLRKVLREHLYEDRLDRIVHIVFGVHLKRTLPEVYIVDLSSDPEAHKSVQESFDRQTYALRHLIRPEEILQVPDDAFIGVFSPRDHYGDNYLTDMMFSLRYCDREGFAKPESPNYAYRPTETALLRRSLIRMDVFRGQNAVPGEDVSVQGQLLYVDEFNYQMGHAKDWLEDLDDIFVENQGLSIQEIEADLPCCPEWETLLPKEIYDVASRTDTETVHSELTSQAVYISNCAEKGVQYKWLSLLLKAERYAALENGLEICVRMKTLEGSEAVGACIFVTEGVQMDIGPVFLKANEPTRINILPKCRGFRLQVRLEPGSIAQIIGITLRRSFKPFWVNRMEQSDTMILTKFYPQYDKLCEKVGMNIDNSDIKQQVEQQLNLKQFGNIKEDIKFASRIIRTALSRESQILNNSNKQLKSQHTDIKLKQEKAERDNKKYLKIIKIKKFGVKKKTKTLKTFLKNKVEFPKKFDFLKNKVELPKKFGISIIIPTYKENAFLDNAIKSVLNQDYPSNKLEIIIAVNGEDVKYYHELKNKYASNKIKVVYTEIKGANAGRKIGLDYASFPYFTFLDDDDFFTNGYLNYMISGIQDDETNIVIGKLVDFDENGKLVTEDTYINRVLNTFGKGKTRNYLNISSLFANLCGKLFRTTFFKKYFLIETNFQHTEDVIFWAENFNHISGNVYLCNTNINENYCRRLTKGSLSRPKEDKIVDFYIKERLKIIDYLSNLLIFKNYSIEHKKFILQLIKAQNIIMEKHYKELTSNQKDDAFKEIYSNECAFLNKSKISDRKAIAFCHNFSPFIDASAFVATKRLHEIDELEGQSLCWLVINQNMANIRFKDELFHDFYSYFQFDKLYSLPGNAAFGAIEQCRFGYFAFKKVENMNDVEVIYSRAQFVGSHIAAWLYKLSHLNVKWYAEFSDPLVYGVDNKVRHIRIEGENSYLNDYYWYIEQFVYTYADKIIFTNQNQMDYMLGYNPFPENNENIRDKAIVKHHPVLPSLYAHIIESDYDMDLSKINIGYFGTFYANRNFDDMLKLLSNPQVILHIFTPNSEKLKEKYIYYQERIRFNETICNLEFLNLASKMDYLFLNDTNFVGDINPYLPSKYADYKVTNTKIIVKIVEGSVLSEMDDKQLIKCKLIDENFAKQLLKLAH